MNANDPIRQNNQNQPIEMNELVQPTLAYWQAAPPIGYHAQAQEEAPQSPAEVSVESQENQGKRNTLCLVRMLVGVALSLVGIALLFSLLNWLKQDITTYVRFFQSEIQ